jgi:hypothetical protein
MPRRAQDHEVSDTTLAYDLGRKLAAYARTGVPN